MHMRRLPPSHGVCVWCGGGGGGRGVGGAALGVEWLAIPAQCVTLEAYGGPAVIVIGIAVSLIVGISTGCCWCVVGGLAAKSSCPLLRRHVEHDGEDGAGGVILVEHAGDQGLFHCWGLLQRTSRAVVQHVMQLAPQGQELFGVVGSDADEGPTQNATACTAT
ncbi:hypothetical protein N9L68_01490 [bacterium]|nr:hypothetical protein [bacterium]